MNLHPDWWLGRHLTINGQRYRVYSYLVSRGYRLQALDTGLTSYQTLGPVEWDVNKLVHLVEQGKVRVE